MFKFFKKIKKLSSKNGKKGITLVIAITTMTLLLSISLSISNIVLRQIRITNINNNSKPAFFIADSAVECAFYYDTLFVSDGGDPEKNTNADFETAIFGLAVEDEDDGSNFIVNNVPCGERVYASPKIINEYSTSTVVISRFDIDYGNMCAKVEVEKTEVDTKITARGYNTTFDIDTGCILTDADSRRLVERGLTLKY